jgi:hypothetical protein
VVVNVQKANELFDDFLQEEYDIKNDLGFDDDFSEVEELYDEDYLD